MKKVLLTTAIVSLFASQFAMADGATDSTTITWVKTVNSACSIRIDGSDKVGEQDSGNKVNITVDIGVTET